MSQETESDAARTAKDYSDRLALSDHIFEPTHVQVVAWLEIMPGSHLLDAGCGAGGMTQPLAKAVGDDGTVLASDIAPAHLAATRTRLEGTPFAARVKYLESSVDALPPEVAGLDLIWCSHVVHGQPEPLLTLRELRRVLKPGGRLVLREDQFLSRLLPFESHSSGLEERIRAVDRADFLTWQRGFSGVTTDLPGWASMMRQAGFAEVRAKSFALDLTQPLETPQRDFLASILQSWREDEAIRAALSLEERTVLERYTDPVGSDFVLDRPDLHFIHCSSVYLGVAGTPRATR